VAGFLRGLVSPYEGDPIRPPAEAESIILQATVGCPHGGCVFCGAYQRVDFRVRALDDFRQHAQRIAASAGSSGSRFFLGDGDTLLLPTSLLLEFMRITREVFPRAQRFAMYGGPRGILDKSAQELLELKSAGLNTFYLGLESGHEALLRGMGKGNTAAEAIEAVIRAQSAGLRASVIVLLGLGGVVGAQEHARETAMALNRMQPRLLSALTLMVVPGTPLWALAQSGRFQLPSPTGILQELRLLMEGLDLRKCVFRANHASSYLPLEGSLPRDHQALLSALDAALQGTIPLIPEWMRGL